MSLLAETLIDEWLNRKGFMTMRGIRNAGVDEIDLLGVRHHSSGPEGWHVEAQVSFRPVGYVTKLPREFCKAAKKDRNSAMRRPDDLLQWGATEFVDLKYRSAKKLKARERMWPGLKWKEVFVHAVVRDIGELKYIAAEGVDVISFYRVLSELAQTSPASGAAGTDISEIIHYFANQSLDVGAQINAPTSSNPLTGPFRPGRG